MKKYGKNTEAYHDALDAIKVSKVSFSKEFEDFRQLPKYSHIPLAVIHPSPIKRMPRTIRPDPDFEFMSSPTRLHNRPGPQFEIPESLTRPPVEISGGKKSRPKSSLGFGSSQPRFGKKKTGVRSTSKYGNRMEGAQAKAEAERQKVVNMNLKMFYDAMKADLEKSDDEVFNAAVGPRVTVRDAKNAMRVHDLLRVICTKITGLD